MNISKLNIGGTVYDVKDSTARSQILNVAFVSGSEIIPTVPEFDAASQSVHIIEQSLSNAQKTLARANIDAIGKTDIATSTTAGLMSAEDKKKIDAMSTGTWLETSYVINQTEVSEGVYRLPEDMIEDHTASMYNTEKIIIDGNLEYIDVIARIRAHSHIYIGKYNTTSEKLEIKLVSDTDKTKFADGTNVNNYYGDAFMKLPKFWWKCEEIDTDKYKVSFSMTESHVDSTWNLWEGNDFIGVYKGWILSDYMHSKSYKTSISSSGGSYTYCKQCARNKAAGNKYTLVTYDAHKIMCLLGFGWLGTTDASAIIGVGDVESSYRTGICDNKGMNDSSASIDGNTTSTNFWGIEDWWSYTEEFIDNLITDSNNVINVLAPDGTTVVRTIAMETTSSGEIEKMILGSYGDMIPKTVNLYGNNNRGYADHGYMTSQSGRCFKRAHEYSIYDKSSAGLCEICYESTSLSSTYLGSRLHYKGDYEVVDSFSN